tara:strand:+ start:1659 stop:2171 length:513 start_codon:yes stop_codon:yes gene_type:complete
MVTKLELLELLRGKSIEFQIHEHEALYTVEDSENLRGDIIGSHTKNLFLKNKKDSFFLFSCDEGAKVDLKKFSKSISGKNLSFAKDVYLNKYLKIKPGSISPFALLNDFNNEVIFYLDHNLAKSELINFHPLINTTTISLKTKDFIKFMVENNKKINIFSLETYNIVESL